MSFTLATHNGIYIMKSFFLKMINANPKNEFVMQMLSLEIVFSKRAVVCINIYIYSLYGYMYILGAFSLNIMYKIGIGTANSFFRIALIVFWKRARHMLHKLSITWVLI